MGLHGLSGLYCDRNIHPEWLIIGNMIINIKGSFGEQIVFPILASGDLKETKLSLTIHVRPCVIVHEVHTANTSLKKLYKFMQALNLSLKCISLAFKKKL